MREERENRRRKKARRRKQEYLEAEEGRLQLLGHERGEARDGHLEAVGAPARARGGDGLGPPVPRGRAVLAERALRGVLEAAEGAGGGVPHEAQLPELERKGRLAGGGTIGSAALEADDAFRAGEGVRHDLDELRVGKAARAAEGDCAARVDRPDGGQVGERVRDGERGERGVEPPAGQRALERERRARGVVEPEPVEREEGADVEALEPAAAGRAGAAA